MTIEPINYENAVWNSVIEYAESCSWKAGPFVAKDMREHHFMNWEYHLGLGQLSQSMGNQQKLVESEWNCFKPTLSVKIWQTITELHKMFKPLSYYLPFELR